MVRPVSIVTMMSCSPVTSLTGCKSEGEEARLEELTEGRRRLEDGKLCHDL